MGFSDSFSPSILFTTHVDTVPDYISPTLSKDNKTIFGRGTCDAKGIAACMILAADALRKRQISVGLLFVVGEETDSIGAKTAARFGIKAKYLINGEPTELKLIRAMKGVVSFELKCKGIAAHSAYPEAGHSATHQLIQDLNQLIELDWPVDSELGKTTCNIGIIQGGKASNVLADSALAKGIIRTTTTKETIIELISSHIHPKTILNIISSSDPERLKTVAGIKTDVVSFGSDIPYLKSIGEPLLFGPGSILDAHTTQEHIHIDDLVQAIELYIKLGIELTC